MEDPKKKAPNRWLALINIPIQMGAIIFIFAWIGTWLDENHPNPKIYYNKVLIVVGVFLALYNVIRQVNEMNKNE
ncbi:AtpZ/AtpI family protein [Flavobacterium saliperosum]|uniref:Putative F0F1-ATPase subunit Ca2+/Mg2+ transporter n=1 Tax=Flavobacterium saliperosum TaxID=329186 RepID=A0A1G4W3L3_9FLAO|nr:AtpZ/AtpI family protein [Flavobacterium saliperosum]SCX16189.1 Putative F0F1-ATPase subunit Ca2+/Mg2+ transporter [Flavobacterium saliperosum]